MIEKRLLVLEDGTIFRGFSFGSGKEVEGEVVFATGMSGYVESLSDPSYRGQILTMTYPLQGNYGVCKSFMESNKIQVRGFIVSEACFEPSHYTSEMNIHDFLKEYDIPGIHGVDTRALTRRIRVHGTMRGKICHADVDVKKIVKEIQERPYPDASDLIPEVTRKKIEEFGKGKLKVALIDCGVKQSIIDCLVKRDAKVVVVPAKTSAEEILKLKPDGVLISNGPGDPSKPTYVIETIKKLFGKLPMFGICLGNQMIALAAGANTYKLKFGHRGLNHSIKSLKTGKNYITTQNHGYAVDRKTLEGSGFKETYFNLNDESVEGIKHEELPIFATQWHVEGGPGPHDTEFFFDEFVEVMNK